MAAKRDRVKPVTIMITRWERDLILRYGYPFEDIKRQLEEASAGTGNRRGPCRGWATLYKLFGAVGLLSPMEGASGLQDTGRCREEGRQYR